MTLRTPDGTPQDLAASLVSLILVAGLVYLAAQGADIPASLAMALGSATTWLFVRASPPAVQIHATNTPTAQGAASDAYYGFAPDPNKPLSKP